MSIFKDNTPENRRGNAEQIKILQDEIERHLKSKLIVLEKLTDPDKLVVDAKNSLLSKTADYKYKGTIKSSHDILNTRASSQNIFRALRFWDTLIKALRYRGHDIVIRNSKTYVLIGTDEFEILVREKSKREVVKGDRWDSSIYSPTGILSFYLGYVHKEWQDGKIRLEDQMSKIIANIEFVGNEFIKLRLEQRKEEERILERELIRKELEDKQRKDLQNFKKTLEKASRWNESINLNNYINEVEANGIAQNNYTDELKDWIKWARAKADWYNPFIEKEDEVLVNVDRETLTNKK